MNNMVSKIFNSQNIIFTIGAIIYIILIITMTNVALMFFATFVIASSLEPLVKKLEKKYKRSTASAIVLGGFIGIILLLFLPICIIGCNEIRNLGLHFSEQSDNIKGILENIPFLRHLDLSNIDIGAFIAGNSDNIIEIIKGLSMSVVYFIVSIIFTYFTLADRELLINTYLKFFPKKTRAKRLEIINITTQKISGYITGMVAGMVCVGAIMMLGLLFLLPKYAVMLGFITAIFDIIPVVGPAIALIICLLVAYSSGPVVLALIVLVFLIAQLVENNLVKPYVFGKLLNLHPLVIYIFLFICAKFLGIVGAIFAPAIAASVCVFIEELYLKNMEN